MRQTQFGKVMHHPGGPILLATEDVKEKKHSIEIDTFLACRRETQRKTTVRFMFLRLSAP